MNKKRSRSEHGSRKMRKNLSKTKRRPRSNKKGALKGIRNNKTKIVKKRRIVQRGGNKKYDDLVTAVMIDNVDDVGRILQKGDVAHLRNYPPENNTVLYTACRSPTPNLKMVELLLTWGFDPNIPNGQNRSYPQHGVVAAANQILGSEQLFLEQKNEKLKVLKDILEELRRKGADMSLKNRLRNGSEYTAYTEYSDMFGQVQTPSIESRIAVIDHVLSVRIGELLRPPPGAPPPGYGAPPPGYGAPPPGYGAPPPGYGAPPPGYSAPPPGYSAPPPGYGAPPPGYGAPPHGYSPPQPGYSAPPPSPPPPPSVYDVPPPEYGGKADFFPNFYDGFKGIRVCYSLLLPYSLQYKPGNNVQTNHTKSYFVYMDNPYYFSDDIQEEIYKKWATLTVQRVGLITFFFTYDGIEYSFYIPREDERSKNKLSAYVSFKIKDEQCWVKDAPFIYIKKQ